MMRFDKSHHPQDSIFSEVLQVKMATLQIWDGSKDPPTFLTILNCPTVNDAVYMADDLVRSIPKQLYSVYNDAGKLEYQR